MNPNDVKTVQRGYILNEIEAMKKQDQGSHVAPQGCLISPCNSTISIEPNFATFDQITLVESIKMALTWSQYDPYHVILHFPLLPWQHYSVKSSNISVISNQ